MPDARYWARVLLPEIRRATGRRYPALERELENLPVDVLMDLHRFMQDMGTEMEIARKKGRFWPGGPR